jgi:PAS domain S-box-containing protein
MDQITNEELCRQIVQACNDAIIYSDREGIIRLWNSGAEQMLGFIWSDDLSRRAGERCQ